MKVSKTLLIFEDRASFEEFRYFVEGSTIWVWLIFSNGYTVLIDFGEEDHRGKVSVSSHHSKDTYY